MCFPVSWQRTARCEKGISQEPPVQLVKRPGELPQI